MWERVTRALDAPDVLYVEMRAQREREDAVDDQDARDLMAISLELEELDRGLGSLAAAMRTLAGSGHAAAVLLEQVELLDAHRGRLLERESEADARRAQGIASENALRDLVAAVGARQDSGGGLSVQQKRELLRLLAVKAFVRKGGDGERIVVTAKVDLDRFAAPDPERPGRKRI